MGLNFRNVLVALGQLDEELIGHESGGIITRMRPDTEASGLAVGERESPPAQLVDLQRRL